MAIASPNWKIFLSFRMGLSFPLPLFCGKAKPLILFVPGMVGVYVASALCGVSLSCFMAMSSYLISVSVEKEAVAKASGMFSIIGGIGGLVAPIVLGNVATYVLGGNHPVNQFTIAFVGMLIFGIVVTISGRKMKEKNQ